MESVVIDGFVLFFFVALAGAAAVVADNKGRSGVAFFLFGLLCWPLALGVALLISPDDDALRDYAADRTARAKPRLRPAGSPSSGNYTVTCTACGAETPAALSFCTSCRAPRAAP